MLPDVKIDSLDTHLEQFKLNDQSRQTDLTNLLKEYGQLLDDYKVLKRAYQEKGAGAVANSEAVATPSAPTVANPPRNPYVLMIVDGNDYIFNDELIREKEEGGMRAARMLNDAVEKYLQQNNPQAHAARVIVRIYADLTNLSKQLAKSKVTGLEKRSIAPFSAAFTRAMSLFDFVDALDEEGSRFKIREQFKIASEDTACSHILYAACNSPAYLSQLVPYSGQRDKITLVQGAGWNPEFHQFNLNVTQFPTIFRWSELPVAPPNNKSIPSSTAPKQKVPVQKPMLISEPLTLRKESWRRNGSMSVTDSAFGDFSSTESNGFNEQERVGWENQSAYNTQTGKATVSKPPPVKDAQQQQLCKYFQKGFCRFGNKCNFQHVPKGLDGATSSNGTSNNQNIFSSPGAPSSQPSSQTTPPSNNTPSYSHLLPKSPIPGFIPLNKFLHRLDTYAPAPSASDWDLYTTRFQKIKPCNSFHLSGTCTAWTCPYDHSTLDPHVKRVLAYVVKCNPCPRKGACRQAKCVYGHLCQKVECGGAAQGGKGKCRFKAEAHFQSDACRVASLVPAEEEEEDEGGGGVRMVSVDSLIGLDDGGFMW